MRARIYDASVTNSYSDLIRAVGTTGGSPVDYTFTRGSTVTTVNRGFFVDEPHRSWTLPFGEASRWEEKRTPASQGDVLDGGFDTIAGHPPSNVVYIGYRRYSRIAPHSGKLFSHWYNDELNAPWPYRLRNRVSLNNAVQAQRRKLSSHSDGVAETIGELPECKQLFKLVSRYRGLKSNSVGLYLGYKFGWRPTYEAFAASCQELAYWLQCMKSIHARRNGTLTLVYRGSDDWSLARVNKQDVIAYATPYSTADSRGIVATTYLDPVLERHEGTITYMARINSQARFEHGWDSMSRLARIGAIPSLTTMWALLPSSFLCDWFVSIGDMISYFQGNLLYDQELLCEAWSWSLKDTMSLHLQGRVREHLWTQEVSAFYRSRSFPLGIPWMPRIGLVSTRVLPTLAALLASRLPGDTASLRTIYRTLKRMGYAW